MDVKGEGLGRTVEEEIILDKPERLNIRGKLVFAVRNDEGELVEVVDGDYVSIKAAYPLGQRKEGRRHYFRRYTYRGK